MLIISGINFGLSGTVLIGTFACTTGGGGSWSHTQIQCYVGPGQGTGLPVTITVGACAAVCAAVYCALPVPAIQVVEASVLSLTFVEFCFVLQVNTQVNVAPPSYSYAAPTISGASPGNGPTDGKTVVLISGQVRW